VHWRAYVTAQSAFGKSRRQRLSDGRQRNWSQEHYGHEIAALERACNGVIAPIGGWAAGHVRLIGDRHFDGLCGNGSATSSRKQRNGNGDQGGQDRASKSHGWTIWRYGLRVNGVHEALMCLCNTTPTDYMRLHER
jgi:hypothetical protein